MSDSTVDSDAQPTRSSTESVGERGAGGLLSDEPTVELILRARGGDAAALEALLQRALPLLTRWAHGRLPPAARGHMDTSDLVQEAVLKGVQHLDTFEPRGVGAMQAYLRQTVLNRIRDEVRRVQRRGVAEELPEQLGSDEPSPFELAVVSERYDHYRAALALIEKARDRQLVVARLELQWSYADIAGYFQYRTVDGARMATTRALDKLAGELALVSQRRA